MTRRLAEMTWTAVAGAVSGAGAAGAITVILPLGATEQHGPHLPLGTDTFRAAALADRLAAALPDTLVAPALPVGCSDEHHGFAGLLGLDQETLARVIVDCARRMAGWGVGRLVLLSAHGGNGRALEVAAGRLAEELPELRVVVLGGGTTLSDAILAVAARDGIPADAVGLHAGEGETSEMLALRPDLVLMDSVVPGYRENLAQIMPRLRREGLRSVTPTGTLGDATGADGARGARYLAAETECYRRAVAGSPEMAEGPPS
jgi:mycofactocin precursor peptide peptidase